MLVAASDRAREEPRWNLNADQHRIADSSPDLAEVSGVEFGRAPRRADGLAVLEPGQKPERTDLPRAADDAWRFTPQRHRARILPT